ncbi:MAG: hypothetical protein ACRD9R_09600 [Pyrinomonadaceae bacterium]
MSFKKVGLVARPLFLALGLFMALPVAVGVAQAQDGYWNQDDRRRERRQDRRERRRDRRDDRRERRDDRRGDEWDRYDNYGGSSQLRQTALNAGYNNGIQEGRKDRSRNERFNYSDESDYQKATEDYSSRLGDKELYRRYFRTGFQNGYADGYEGY